VAGDLLNLLAEWQFRHFGVLERYTMAKRQQHPRTQAHGRARDAEPAEPKQPTQKTLRLIDDIRRPFAEFVDDFGAITQSRQELAPRFMRAFNAWAQDTQGSFVAFVRLLVPEVPAAREGYRAHPAYQAADYLRRLAAQPAEREQVAPEDRPATPGRALAKVLAAILPMLSDPEALWAAFIQELHWTPEQIARLQGAINREGPIQLQGRLGRRATNGFTLQQPAAAMTAAGSRPATRPA
jgi:hypothetical protein